MKRIYRSQSEPKNSPHTSWEERWGNDEKSMITCWEVGRQMREEKPTLAKRAESGELLSFGTWKGAGTKPDLEHEYTAYGTYFYLATWQGLRGADLDVNLSTETTLVCSKTGTAVTYTTDYEKIEEGATKISASKTATHPQTTKHAKQKISIDKIAMNQSLNFIAVDVETANADRASICQIGIVHVRDGEIVDKWESLVNPECWFDEMNIDVHGIDEDDVANAPIFPAVYDEVNRRLHNSVVVCHTAFDQIAFTRVVEKYKRKPLQVTWLDSAKIVRRGWPEKYGQRGYGLKNVASDFNIEFNHHNALEDAQAAAKITIHACNSLGMKIEDWLIRVNKPVHSKKPAHPGADHIKGGGNRDGVLYGESVVFTGALTLPRREIAKIAMGIGCNVQEGVNRKTTLLVVGIQDETKLNGYEKSSKHRKAESMKSKGADIQILSEDDFFCLVENQSK